jgi:hemerythrin-like metal-binding protein
MEAQPLRLAWEDAFALGIPDMDADHRHFLELMNDLHEATASGDGRVHAVRGALLAHATCHILGEEKVMEGLEYPGLAGQRKEHAWFLHRLESLWLGDPETTSEVLAFLREWFVDHVLGRDRAFARWLSAVGHSEPVHLHGEDP